ncbi:MAG: hypothetical protein IJS39_11015 [Synergistaceae bacterium]|nr:hypothetical protein [Synergistaceae bacterium]
MTSNDNPQYITVELFNSKMETFITQIRLDNEQLRNELNSKIESVRNELNSKIDSVQASLHTEIQVNSAKIEMLQHTFYWGFAILALIVAFVPMFRREHKEKQQQQPMTRDKVVEIVREIIAESAIIKNSALAVA